MIPEHQKIQAIQSAISERKSLAEKTNTFRLFNGFYEGFPGLVIDRYGETLAIFDHNQSGESKDVIHQFTAWALDALDGVNSIILKQRQSPDIKKVNGVLIKGNVLTTSINEFDVAYALDLQLNQDASFYLDTRDLRRWLLKHSQGLKVLNTFAYTGSLGVAAGMGGASLVIQTDLNQSFLNLAKKSCALNNLDQQKCQHIAGDFFKVTDRMRHANRLFNCVILDPPFFSTTDAGRVDLQQDVTRLINKVRPLVAHEGWLVVINNALFVSGKSFMEELNTLCKSPYLSFAEIIPIPPDVTGYPNTIIEPPPVNPAPFNHPTKIAILKVFRKDERK